MSEANEPDSQEFARTVLHNLAGLTAEVNELKFFLVEVLSKVTNTPAEHLKNHCTPQVLEHTEALYQEYLRRANIAPGPGDLPPFPDRGASPTE